MPLKRWLGFAQRNPLSALLGIAALAVCAYVIVYPFTVVHYPPITDLPFHASSMSILRHYGDPEWHFREQFTLHPLEVPYISMYAVGVAATTVASEVWAAKVMAIVMLALLPAGMAVLLHGMKKTPLWALVCLPVVWTNLTHWGFLNFMGALGLFAMCVGFTLLVVDEPTRPRRIGLALSLLAVFFTHIYRFPFAVLAIAGTAVLMYPATRRLRPVLLPVLPALGVFAVWSQLRTGDLAERPQLTRPDWARLDDWLTHVVTGFAGAEGERELQLFEYALDVGLVLLIASVAMFFWQGRASGKTGRELWWGFGVTVLPVALAAGFVAAYLMMPMRIGIWWYVYPREITSALFIVLAAVPDLPKQWAFRAPAVAAMIWATGQIGFFIAEQYYAFDSATADFRAIQRHVTKAPKLMYLVFEHRGSTRKNTPFIHLPAWIQAERGGWLSFHFIGWQHSPIRYRENDPNVPPPVPDRWEWTPWKFRVQQHGAFFDEFLVRSGRDPSHLFRRDSTIQLVQREGDWWLYRRGVEGSTGR